MPYVPSFDGTPLWYEIHGNGGGEPLLLIAGNGCDHSVWEYVIDDFAPQRPVIIYDHRGTGKSGCNFTETWSTRDFARDAFAILQGAGISRAHVYGHSMGGRVAQWFAADWPESTGALILGATSVGEKKGVARSDEATKAMMENDSGALQSMCYPPQWISAHPEQAMSGAPNPRNVDAFLCHLRASGEHDSWDIAAELTSPTLVVHGSEDGITHPDNARILASRIPGATLLIIDKGRHVYWAGRPEVHTTVTAFIKDTDVCSGR